MKKFIFVKKNDRLVLVFNYKLEKIAHFYKLKDDIKNEWFFKLRIGKFIKAKKLNDLILYHNKYLKGCENNEK